MLREGEMQVDCHWKKFEFGRYFAIQPLRKRAKRVKNLTVRRGARIFLTAGSRLESHK
jgi:hypothetical protein